MFIVTIELDLRDPAPDLSGYALTVLDHLRPAIALSARGWMTIILTIEASNAKQAMLVGYGAAVQATGQQVVHISSTVAAEFEDRRGWDDFHAVVSAAEAARMTGVGEAHIVRLVEAGELRGAKIGSTYAVSRDAVIR